MRGFYERGLLIREAFTYVGYDDDDDTHRVCWLAALSPEVEAAEAVEACPTSFLPRQFAQLVPWLDDAGIDEDDDPQCWESRTARFVTLMERAHVLEAEDWEHFDKQVFRRFVELFTEVLAHPSFRDEQDLLSVVTLHRAVSPETYVLCGGLPPSFTKLILGLSHRQWADVASQFGDSYHAYVGGHKQDMWWDKQDIEERIITDILNVFEQVIDAAEGRLACTTPS